MLILMFGIPLFLIFLVAYILSYFKIEDVYFGTAVNFILGLCFTIFGLSKESPVLLLGVLFIIIAVCQDNLHEVEMTLYQKIKNIRE